KGAALNGYSNNATAGNQVWDPAPTNGVRVSIPPSSGAYSNSVQYVEVTISKPITTFFAGIFNINAVSVTARAVARGTSGSMTASVVALSPADDAIKSAGSSTAFVTGNVYSAGGIQCGGNVTVYSGGAYPGTSAIHGERATQRRQHPSCL
ncbi:MAG: hypothetical protein M1482_09620, partial [Chloroflexi bacterium]|nr:hypothetical protein [Chloroflexota bacterium]